MVQREREKKKDEKRDSSGREKDRERPGFERDRKIGEGERERQGYERERERKLQTQKNSWNFILSCFTPQNGVKHGSGL